MIIRLIAYLFSRLPNRINLLKKLELNAAFFCWKLALQAQEEGRTPFYNVLIEQAQSEYNHANVLCGLNGGYLGLRFQGLLTRDADKWTIVDWDSSENPYQIAGFSVNYLIGRLFFGFHKASEYSWEDKLAFMSVLENFQYRFYQELLEHIEDKSQYDAINWILKQEEEHAAILLSTYYEINNDKDLLQKWYLRLSIVLFLVPLVLLFGDLKDA